MLPQREVMISKKTGDRILVGGLMYLENRV
jgi:hypothetical protein